MSSCSQSEDTSDLQSSVQIPVEFGSYTSKSVQTRGGYAGAMGNEQLQSQGFGVIAYYTEGSEYADGLTPNFMYNQKVSGSDWSYTPVKYWPNEAQNGDVDNQSPAATAEAADKLSFFAYAPYTDVTVTSGAVTENADYGITAITSNAASGDPKITYVASTDLSKQVDLLWGTVNSEVTTWKNVIGTQTLTEGLPYKDLIKPTISQKVKFSFRHALSKFQLQVVGAFDQVGEGGTLEDGTKVTIEKVEISNIGGGTKGVLNLNNTTAKVPLWETAEGSEKVSMTIEGDALNPDLKYEGKQVQTVDGVTAEEQHLLATEDDALLIIPTSGETAEDVTVKITYYVTTADANLAAGYSQVQNVITKTISDLKLEGGKAYNLKLILGLTEVKFEATVEDWEDGSETEVNLPINVE